MRRLHPWSVILALVMLLVPGLWLRLHSLGVNQFIDQYFDVLVLLVDILLRYDWQIARVGLFGGFNCLCCPFAYFFYLIVHLYDSLSVSESLWYLFDGFFSLCLQVFKFFYFQHWFPFLLFDMSFSCLIAFSTSIFLLSYYLGSILLSALLIWSVISLIIAFTLSISSCFKCFLSSALLFTIYLCL